MDHAGGRRGSDLKAPAGPGASPEPGAGGARSPIRRAELLWLLAILALVFLVRVPTLDQPLIEAHGFRQTQTAYTARLFHERGIDLLHPELPVLGEPWEVPFEFPLFQALASVPMAFGLSPDVAMRATSLFFFAVSAALVWALVRRATRRATPAFAALAAFALSPFAAQWSRASLMEYLAVAGAVGWLLATIAWIDRPRWWVAAIAIAAGTVGLLVKATTAAFWVLPIAAWGLHRSVGTGMWERLRALLRPGLVAVVGFPFVPALLWVRHADAIKGANPLTAWLTERALRTWNYGTPEQRADLDAWVTVGDRIVDLLLGPLPFVLLAGAAFADRSRRGLWLAVALTVVLPVAVFFNLYVVHDYYLAAAAPGVAILLGVGAWRVAQWVRRRTNVRAGLLVAAAGVVWLGTIVGFGWAYTTNPYVNFAPEGVGLGLSEVTRPEDRVVVAGAEWSPHVLYYADRRGIMLTSRTDMEQAADLARRRGYRYFAAVDPAGDPIHLLAAWPWSVPVSPNVWRLVENGGEIEGTGLVGGTDLDVLSRARARGRSLGPAFEVPCGAPVALPASRRATWIRLDPGIPVSARIGVRDGRAPLPPLPFLVILAETGDRPVLQCSGVTSLFVEEIFEAPAPDALG